VDTREVQAALGRQLQDPPVTLGRNRIPAHMHTAGEKARYLIVLTPRLSPVIAALQSDRDPAQEVSTKLRSSTARSQICSALSLSMMIMGPPQRGQDHEPGGWGKAGHREDEGGWAAST
jgi:hypothetical protein